MHTLEIFLSKRPRFLSWGFELGGKGYDAESSFCRGDTPALAGGDPMNKGFFLFPATQKTDIAN